MPSYNNRNQALKRNGAVLSAQSIRRIRPIEPWSERSVEQGLTYGVGPAGYDVRVAESFELRPGDFKLASTIEHFTMPLDAIGIVHDKSTWARRGVCVQNTVIEPGWRGYLTLELTNHGMDRIWVKAGMPIAQIIFHWLDQPTTLPYTGRYQDQPAGAQAAQLIKGTGK